MTDRKILNDVIYPNDILNEMINNIEKYHYFLNDMILDLICFNFTNISKIITLYESIDIQNMLEPVYELSKEIKKIEDSLVFNTINSSKYIIINSELINTSINNSTNERMFNMVKEIKSRISHIINNIIHLISKSIPLVKEISLFDSSIGETHILLDNGNLHNTEFPSILTLEQTHYFINNKELKYKDWVNHPQVRINKINKILNKNE